MGGVQKRKAKALITRALSARRVAQAVAFLAFFFMFSVTVARSEKVEQLSPQGYVNDFAGVVDADSRAKLTALCQELDQKANAQIAVVTIHTLEGDTASDFANRLFRNGASAPKAKIAA